MMLSTQMVEQLPDDFAGKILDVPVGTAILTTNIYRRLSKAQIVALDYSPEMLMQAQRRLEAADISNVELVEGDVGNLDYQDNSFDAIISMNGMHVFPDKKAALNEMCRVLKPGGWFLASWYVPGQSWITDLWATQVLERKGWFTPPYATVNEIRQDLSKRFSSGEYRVDGSLMSVRCQK